jgi:protein subunit release factor B
MSEVYATDREALERDSEIEFIIAGGPGGQHRNKVSSGVRLRHRPSGLVVTATERRSQAANREAAYARLAARLEALQQRDAPRVPTRPTQANKRERRDDKARRGQIKRLRRNRPTMGDDG